jgi:hypothetical protein
MFDGNGPKLADHSFEDRLKSSTMDTILKAKELNVAITIITGCFGRCRSCRKGGWISKKKR